MRITQIKVLETLNCKYEVLLAKHNKYVYTRYYCYFTITTANMASSSSELSTHLLSAHIWLIASSLFATPFKISCLIICVTFSHPHPQTLDYVIIL